jgi:hypothetical protein
MTASASPPVLTASVTLAPTKELPIYLPPPKLLTGPRLLLERTRSLTNCHCYGVLGAYKERFFDWTLTANLLSGTLTLRKFEAGPPRSPGYWHVIFSGSVASEKEFFILLRQVGWPLAE